MSNSELPYAASSQTINKMIGLAAIFLPILLILIWAIDRQFGAASQICFHDSISHFYYSRFAGDVFVGLMIGIGLMLFSFGTVQKRAHYASASQSKKQAANAWDRTLFGVAGAAACGVALFPTPGPGCTLDGLKVRSHADLVPAGQVDGATVPATVDAGVFSLWQSLGYGAESPLEALHFVSAVLMFLILLYFAFRVFRATDDKRYWFSIPEEDWAAFSAQKKLRNRIYAGTSLVMAVAMVGLAVLPRSEWILENNIVFWLESLALVPFGVAWLVKGRIFDALNDPES